MRTIKTIRVGRRAVVVRSNGSVYLVEGDEIDTSAKLAATSPAGCTALSEAFIEAAHVLRERQLEIQNAAKVEGEAGDP